MIISMCATQVCNRNHSILTQPKSSMAPICVSFALKNLIRFTTIHIPSKFDYLALNIENLLHFQWIHINFLSHRQRQQQLYGLCLCMQQNEWKKNSYRKSKSVYAPFWIYFCFYSHRGDTVSDLYKRKR